jgi:hypothetical protein
LDHGNQDNDANEVRPKLIEQQESKSVDEQAGQPVFEVGFEHGKIKKADGA